MKKFSFQEIKEFVSRPHFDEKVILSKDPSWPKISIVTPSYNQAEFIERTILSVLNQNYPNLEYIIIDGGSTDGSIEIIKKYERYIAYWVSEKDKGQSDAVNKGFRISTGTFVGWQNSDDIYFPGAFSEFIKYAYKSPVKKIFYSNNANIDQYDNLIKIVYHLPASPFYAFNRAMFLANQSCFFSKDIFSEIGFLDEKLLYAMDREYFLRAIIALGKDCFKYIDSVWGALRCHEATKSAGDNKTIWMEERLEIRKKYKLNRRFEFIYNQLAMFVRFISLIRHGKILSYLKYKIKG